MHEGSSTPLPRLVPLTTAALELARVETVQLNKQRSSGLGSSNSEASFYEPPLEFDMYRILNRTIPKTRSLSRSALRLGWSLVEDEILGQEDQ